LGKAEVKLRRFFKESIEPEVVQVGNVKEVHPNSGLKWNRPNTPEHGNKYRTGVDIRPKHSAIKC